MSKKSVLVAVDPQVEPILASFLRDRFDLKFCLTVEEAGELLQQPVDLIIIGAHFDNSRMFDLLRYCKATPGLRDIPILCGRFLGGEMEDTAYQGVEIACKALGAVGFVDLYRLRRTTQEAQVHQRLVTLIEQALRTAS